MAAMSKLLDWIGIQSGEREEDYMEDYPENGGYSDEYRDNGKKRRESKVVSLHQATTQLKLVVISPADFDEASEIADHLKARKPVVINLESVDREVARKFIDFMSGAVYALDGTMQKVSAGIFLIAPNNVGIMADAKEEFARRPAQPWN